MQKGNVAPIYAKSLTGSSLQCSEAWICTNISSSSNSSNLCTPIRSIKGNRPPNISRGHQIISIILIPWHGTDLFLSDRLFWSAYNAQNSLTSKWSLCSFSLCSLLWRQRLARHKFFMWSLLKNSSRAKLGVIQWQRAEYSIVEAVSSTSMRQIRILSTSYFQLNFSFSS